MREELKYSNVITDDTSRYIFEVIMKGNDYKESRNALAEELGFSKKAITTRFKTASLLVTQKMREQKDIEFKRFVSRCYDEDGCLSIINIANAHEKDPLELIKIFNEYRDSFTFDESCIAHQFGFSLEALKLGNIEILDYRIKGYSKSSIKADSLYKNQEIQFIKSVKAICNEYYRSKEKNEKSKYLIYS